ncbi:hypothetical protein FRB93_003848 [Tulasnella sp. JGI-2019a]|nr:hypothetical protein FRB93_003848 [Tulasnella sp. JGI-2019a]
MSYVTTYNTGGSYYVPQQPQVIYQPTGHSHHHSHLQRPVVYQQPSSVIYQPQPAPQIVYVQPQHVRHHSHHRRKDNGCLPCLACCACCACEEMLCCC